MTSEPTIGGARGESAGPPFRGTTVFFAVIATWIVPGLGHWLLGRRAKGVLFFAVLTFTFLFGMALGGLRNVRVDDDFFLYFIGEACYAGLAFPALWLTSGLELIESQPRLDAGLLFSTVAGIMNVCVMIDVFETARPRPGAGAEVAA
jgi:hypothetical protein